MINRMMKILTVMCMTIGILLDGTAIRAEETETASLNGKWFLANDKDPESIKQAAGEISIGNIEDNSETGQWLFSDAIPTGENESATVLISKPEGNETKPIGFKVKEGTGADKDHPYEFELVYPEVEATYTVTLTGGANASADPAANKPLSVEQGKEMATVTYTAADNYKFPETSDFYTTASGITVSRISDTAVTVSGTPEADATVAVPDAIPVQEEQTADSESTDNKSDEVNTEIAKKDQLKNSANLADASSAVTYMDATVDENHKVTFTEKSCTEYKVVTSNTTTFNYDTWYVVNSDVIISSRITVDGMAHLILMDGKTMNANAGIDTSDGAILNIYGQSAGTGKLVATAVTECYSGIGGRTQKRGGRITINGGIINATGAYLGSGIGSGGGLYGIDSGAVTINGGTVTATGLEYGAGIGGGICAKGAVVTINGGTVVAVGQYGGAGIGGGFGGNARSFEMYDGTVTAITRNPHRSAEVAHGIGRGGDYKPRSDGEITLGAGAVVYAGDDESCAQVVSDFPQQNHQAYVHIDFSPVEVKLLPSEAVMHEGETWTLTAIVNAAIEKVKWSVRNSDVVTLYSDPSCVNPVPLNTDTTTYTVYAKGISQGDATVTVTSSVEENKKAECAVTVGAPAYPLSVGGTQVTSANAHDVFSDGTVSYNDKTKTLTLNGYNSAGNAEKGILYEGTQGETFKIVLIGSNIVNGSVDGIEIKQANLVIQEGSDGGSINATGSNSAGINNAGSMTIEGGAVTANGNKCGIYAYNGLIVRGGTVNSSANGLVGVGVKSVHESCSIEGTVTSFIASGQNKAIDGIVKNAVAGTGWADPAGTGEGVALPINTGEGQSLDYKKVQFDAYQLWVNGIQVTSDNKDNIPLPEGCGTASYNPETNTLKLNNANITYHGDKTAGIYSELDTPLTIEGKGTNTVDVDTMFGVYATHSLLISGNFNISGKDYGILIQNYWAKEDLTISSNSNITATGGQIGISTTYHGDITIEGGQVEAQGNSTGGIFADGNITINNSHVIAKVNNTGTSAFIWNGKLTLPDDLEVKKPQNYTIGQSGSNHCIAHSDGSPANDVEIDRKAYALWVNGTQVSYDNKDNVLDDAGATVSFNPETRVLTLKGAAISSTHQYFGYDCGIYSGLSELTINGEGKNTITADGNNGYGIYASGNLTLSGSITATGGDNGIIADGNITIESESEISATGNGTNTEDTHGVGIGTIDRTITKHNLLTIKGGTVNASGGVCGISSDEDITIEGGSITSYGTSRDGILAGNDITITGGEVCSSQGGDNGILAIHDISITNAKVTAGTSKANGYAVACDDYSSGTITLNSAYIKEPSTGVVRNNVSREGVNSYIAASSTDDTPASSVVIEPSGTLYNLWVGGKQFSSNNLTLAFGNGTVTYDPETTTLNFDNPQFSETDDMYTLNAGGGNTITLRVYMDLGRNTVLTLKGNADFAPGAMYGIGGTNGLLVNDRNTSIISRGTEYGVYVPLSDLTMRQGNLEGYASSDTSTGVSVFTGNIKVTGGKLNGSGGRYGIQSRNIVINDGLIEGSCTDNGTAAIVGDSTINIEPPASVLSPKGGAVGYLNGSSGSRTITINDAAAKQASIGVHQHDFIYRAEGDTIIATCSSEDCTLPEKTVRLQIHYPSSTAYDGKVKHAYFDDAQLQQFNSTTGLSVSESQIVYSGGEPVNAGGYTASVTLKNVKTSTGVTGDVTASTSFVISQTSISEAIVTIGPEAFSYTGKAQTISQIIVRLGTKTLVRDTDYTVSGTTEGTDAGDYKFTVAGKGNYSGTVEKNWTITKATPHVTAPQALTGLTYTAQNQILITEGDTTFGTLEYAVTESSDVTPSDTDYRQSLPVKEAAGTYYVWYKVPENKNWYATQPSCIGVQIEKAELTLVTVSPMIISYDGQPHTVNVWVKAGRNNVEPGAYTVTGNTATDPGSHQVIVNAKSDSNYKGNATASFHIIQQGKHAFKAELSDTSQTYVYDGNPKTPTVTVKDAQDGDKLDETCYSVSYSDNTNAGYGKITITGVQGGNYEGSVMVLAFDIEKAPITPKVTLEGWTYGTSSENLPQPSVSGNPGSGAVTYQYKKKEAGDSEYSAMRPTDAGTYIVKAMISETDNYQKGSATAEFTIAKGEYQSSFFTFMKPSDLVYSGSEKTASVIRKSGEYGMISDVKYYKDDTIASPVLPGTYTVKIDVQESQNYNAVKGLTAGDWTFAVGNAPLTIKANNKEIIYGSEPADNGVTITGLVGQDTRDDLNGKLSYSFNYSQYGNVGNYDITPSGLSSDNYDISWQTGVLTVSQRSLPFTWQDTDLEYTGSERTVAATPNTINGDVVTLTYEGNTATAVGTYTAKVKSIEGDKAVNYVIDEASAEHTWRILSAVPQINPPTAKTDLVYQGTPLPLVEGGSVEPATLKLVYAVTASTMDMPQTYSENIPEGTNAGVYYVWYKVMNTGVDYEPTVIGPIQIAKASPSIETAPSAKDITYGDSLKESKLTGGKAKFKDTEVPGTFSWINSAIKPAVADSGITPYRVIFTPTDTDGNFGAVECGVTLTVNKAPAPASIPDAAKPTANTLTFNEKAQNLVTAPKSPLAGYAIEYSTDGGTTWSSAIPTGTDVGEYEVKARFAADGNHEPLETVLTLKPVMKNAYYISAGDGQTWTKGSNAAMTVTFKAKTQDEKTYSNFTGLKVDNSEVSTVNYTTQSGSVIITIRSAFLESLSEGTHTITAAFADGDAATGKFTVVKKSGGSPTPEKKTDNVVTCQMAGYPANYAWNEAAKACQPGYIDANGVFRSTAKTSNVPNTYDKGVGGNAASLLIATVFGIGAAYMLRKYR